MSCISEIDLLLIQGRGASSRLDQTADQIHPRSTAPTMLLVGKWFVFWSVGVRLVLGGLRQFFQPRFTSEQIFSIKSDEVLPLVRELGVANFATGVVGIISLAKPSFTPPAATVLRRSELHRGDPACCGER